MTRRGRWLRGWQQYPDRFIQALREAAEGSYTVGFGTAKQAQSFRVRMQKMQKGLIEDTEAPRQLKVAAGEVAWGMPDEQIGIWYVTGTARKARYVTVEELEREMIESNR